MSALAEGVYFIRNVQTKTAVTVDTSFPNPKLVGSKYSFDNADQQLFSVKRIGKDNRYLIIHVQTGRAVDLKGSDSADNTPIITNRLHWGDNQLWNITPNDGAYWIRSVSSGKLVDLSGGDSVDGIPVINYTANCDKNQLWDFKRVGLCCSGNGETPPPPPPTATGTGHERCWLGVVRTRRVVQARARAGVEDRRNVFDKELGELMGYVMGLPDAHWWWHNSEYRRSVQQFSDKWDLGMRWANASQRQGVTGSGGDVLNRMKWSVVQLWAHHNRSDDMIKMEWMETLVAMFEYVHGRPS